MNTFSVRSGPQRNRWAGSPIQTVSCGAFLPCCIICLLGKPRGSMAGITVAVDSRMRWLRAAEQLCSCSGVCEGASERRPPPPACPCGRLTPSCLLHCVDHSSPFLVRLFPPTVPHIHLAALNCSGERIVEGNGRGQAIQVFLICN